MSSLIVPSSCRRSSATIDPVPSKDLDVYFSADIETDGPIPGDYSMLSFAVCVAGTYDGTIFSRSDPAERVFYRELRPISERLDPEAMEVNGLDRERLAREGDDPRRAMDEAAAWIRRLAGDARPVLVAAPVAFDWSFLYWYFVRYSTTGSPFGFSSCLDVRSFYQGAAGTRFSESGRSALPKSLLPGRPHTHHAAEDALEQAELFANVFEWAHARRRLGEAH